jgi:diadenosine tetraphosphatase ApaH/serine/threonine PP2A family protein phosphatase
MRSSSFWSALPVIPSDPTPPSLPPPPPAARRTIVIGDLHGCRDEAEDLLDKLAVTSADRVIFAGDLVDRGPYPRECVELAMRHEAILGNHEEKHLQQRKRAIDKLKPDHARTRLALEASHFEYLAGLPNYLRLPEHEAVVVHAGVLPGRTIESQPDHILLHGQCVSPPAKNSMWPSKAAPGWTFWTNHWQGPERVIFGHTVLSRPLVSRWAVGIDTGCVHGLTLTAVVLPGWEIVSVPARRDHHGPKGDGVARYPVMDGVTCYS